ncbi:hypothetical protein AAMO2058_000588300 [Amorphochlora amoebiformis]
MRELKRPIREQGYNLVVNETEDQHDVDPPMQRLISRDPGNFQAGKPRLELIRHGKDWGILLSNTFTTIIDLPTWKLIMVVFLAYFIFNLLVGLIFYIISDECGLDVDNFNGALIFALLTTTTIGFGIRSGDPYMGTCRSGAVLLFIIMVLSILLDALLLGLVWQRLSRADIRGKSILFSDKAIIRRIDGIPYFIFQVCEMRHHTLVEGHVRCYCVRRFPNQDSQLRDDGYIHAHLQQQAMRLQIPDDELGGFLFMGLPSLVVHRIDAWSPLAPLVMDRDSKFGGCGNTKARNCRNSHRFPEILMRAGDVDAGEREGVADEKHNGTQGGGITATDGT